MKLLRYLWALPNSVFILPLVILAAPWKRGNAKVVDGVIEVHGGLLTWMLRNATVLKGGATAATFGHVVIGRSQRDLDGSRAHERVHVRQYERWGPFFLPAYLLASVWLWIRGKDPYLDNPFEREAYGFDGKDPER